MRTRNHTLVLGLVLGLYGLGLLTPAAWACGEVLPGLVLLAVGWMPPFCLPWCANLLLGIGVLSLARDRCTAASVLGMVAAVLGLTTWVVAGKTDWLLGYYLWQASPVMLALGAHVISFNGEQPSGAAGTPSSALPVSATATSSRSWRLEGDGGRWP